MSLLGALAIEGGIVALRWAYHRLDDALRIRPAWQIATQAVQVPLTAVGSTVPLYFGKVRIRAPILAQLGPIGMINSANWGIDGPGVAENLYGMDQLYVLGVPFQNGTNKLHRMWAGELPMTTPLFAGLDALTGAGNHEQPTYMTGTKISVDNIDATANYPAGFGLVEFLNGNPSQEVVHEVIAPGIQFSSQTYLADRLSALTFTGLGIPLQIGGTTAPDVMPSYRGYTSAFLFNGSAVMATLPSSTFHVDFTPDHGVPVWNFDGSVPQAGNTIEVVPWILGGASSFPVYSFETSSYPNTSFDQPKIGDDANPADVVKAICVDSFGKLGLASTLIDYETHRACAEQLRIEGMGYSRAFDQPVKARDALQEIMRQVDGVFWPDYAANALKMKLIRADFNVNDLLEITPDNCEKIEEFTIPQLGTANRIKVTFINRSKDYADDAATAESTATAASSGPSEFTLSCPGVTTSASARTIASRELTWRCIPQLALRATCDRTFRRLTPGSVVLLSWPESGFSKRAFRVGNISDGGPTSNKTIIDLVQDGAFVYRSTASDNGLPSHPLPNAA